jgi:DNA repair exonuclease SbcCD ATPase subunit
LCGSKVTATFKERHEEEIKQQMDALEVELTDWEKQKSANRSERNKRMDQLNNKRLRLREVSQQLQKLEAEAGARKQIEALRKQQLETAAMVQERIADLERALGFHKLYLEFLDSHKQFLEDCLQAVSREGLPSYLCARVCPQLNTAAARYSQVFADGEVQIRFTIEGGDLDLEVTNEHGGQGVKAQSMGELRLVALAAIFAFREVLVPVPLLILDEPGEGLDQYSAAVFAKGLREVASRFGSVFVTSHNPNILSSLECDRHLEVVKQNKVSEVRRVL